MTAARLRLLGILVGVWLAPPCLAQTAEEDSVAHRPRPDFDPDGVMIPDTDLLLYPTLQTAAITNTNALKTDQNHHGDFAERISAGLELQSDEETHGWRLSADGDSTRYLRFSSQDGDQAKLKQSGFIAPTEETRVDLDFSEQWLVEPIQDSGSGFRQQRPTRYADYSAQLAFGYTEEDWQVSATEQAVAFRYAANAPVIVGDEYDRDELTSTLRVAHQLFEGTALYIEPQVNLRHYVREIGLDGLRHSSSGGQIAAGVRYDLSGVTFIEASAGWLRQDYVDHAFATVTGPAMQGRAVWNPLDRISFTAGLTRQIAESNLPGTAGAETTAESVAADYEIDDNLLAGCNFSFTNLQYKVGVGTSARTDDIAQYGGELRYLIDRNLAIAASWTDYQRHSTVTNASLAFQQVTLSAQIQW